MIEIKIEFTEPVSWISALVKGHSARIKIRDIRNSREGVKDLVEIFTPKGGISNLSSDLASEMGVSGKDLTLVDGNHAAAIVDAHECSICNTILKWDLFLTSAESDENGNITMCWITPDEKTASGFIDQLRRDGVSFDLLMKRSLTRKGEITTRQESVVRLALDLGYFDYPKRVNLEGLSDRLGVSYVTLAEILRRAEKNIISSYFGKRKG